MIRPRHYQTFVETSDSQNVIYPERRQLPANYWQDSSDSSHIKTQTLSHTVNRTSSDNAPPPTSHHHSTMAYDQPFGHAFTIFKHSKEITTNKKQPHHPPSALHTRSRPCATLATYNAKYATTSPTQHTNISLHAHTYELIHQCGTRNASIS
jgi:hypothetical protein